MSDAKKQGSRDISELKQRLGLKKGAAAAGSTGSSARSNGGVVAPPGVGLPPPPGLAPPQPAQPAIPNAADDPFGAMNAMAAVATVQRAPEIVIVNDGRPVENVHTGKGSLLKILVPGLLALVIGVAIGKIGTSAAVANESIKGAKVILGEKTSAGTVAYLKKTLSDLDTMLDEAKTKRGFKPDLDVDKALKEFAGKLDVAKEQKQLYIASGAVARSSDELGDQLLAFYAGVHEIKDAIDAHDKAALTDDILLKKGKENADAKAMKESENALLAGQVRYGVVVSAPTENAKGAEFGAKLVEIAGVYCGGSKQPTSRCGEGEAPSGFAYRTDPNGPQMNSDLVTSGSDSIPAGKILMILGNGVRDSLIKGGEPTVAEYAYQRRLRTLYERIRGKPTQDGKTAGGLLDDGNKLESKLQAKASESSHFTFGM